MVQSTQSPAEPIYIFTFSANFEAVCHSSEMSGEAAIWPIHPDLKNLAVLSIKTVTPLRYENCKLFKRSLNWYEVVVQHVLSTHVLDDVVIEAKNNLKHSTYPAKISAYGSSQLLWDKLRKCRGVRDAASEKDSFSNACQHVGASRWRRSGRVSKGQLIKVGDTRIVIKGFIWRRYGNRKCQEV